MAVDPVETVSDKHETSVMDASLPVAAIETRSTVSRLPALKVVRGGSLDTTVKLPSFTKKKKDDKGKGREVRGTL